MERIAKETPGSALPISPRPGRLPATQYPSTQKHRSPYKAATGSDEYTVRIRDNREEADVPWSGPCTIVWVPYSQKQREAKVVQMGVSGA